MTQRRTSIERRTVREDENVLPHMMKSRQVGKYLGGLSARNLFDLRPFLHYLDLPRQSLSYPLPFLNALREELRDRPGDGNVVPARDFAGTEIARDLVRAEESLFERRVTRAAKKNDGRLVHASDIVTILNIGNATLTDWQTRQDYEVIKLNEKVYMDAETLLAIPWHRPEGLLPLEDDAMLPIIDFES